MRKIFYFFKKIKYLPKFLNPKEAWLIKIMLIIIFAASIYLTTAWYLKNSTIVPKIGGTYIEGIVGSPSLINPILAQTNEVDRDITKLLFNGLLKQESGQTVNDLAKSYSLSQDKLTYTFKLKQNVKWHNGLPFSADDVVFTIQSIQNPEFKSPLYSSMAGVLVKKIDNYTVEFKLPEPFAPFPSLLTFGILPKEVWMDIPATTAPLADLNTKNPIGTGPFKIKSFKKDSRGNIKAYTLTRNKNYYNGAPFIETITFKFYPDLLTAIEALNNNNIDGINYLPQDYQEKITKKTLKLHHLSLPQYSAIFFNQQKNIALENIDIRQALTMAIDRKKLVNQILNQQGKIIYGPILPGFIGYNPDITKFNYNPTKAKELIQNSGWKKITLAEYNAYQEKIKKQAKAKEEKEKSNEKESTKSEPALEQTKNLTEPETQNQKTKQDFFWQKKDLILNITLTTVDNPETSKVAQLIQDYWQKIGVQVKLEIVPKQLLLTQIIKPKNYQALLFGQIVGQDPDPYAFWHSSQIEDPGVNLALYNNKKVDTLLEEARTSSNPEERAQKYLEFQNILKQDLPAIFLYNPTYPYLIDEKVKGFNLKRISIPADRFNNIENWYIKTKREL